LRVAAEVVIEVAGVVVTTVKAAAVVKLTTPP